MYDAFIERFGHWRNLQIFPVAVSDTVADDVSFYKSDQSTGISSLLDFHPSHELAETVATRRLDALPLDHLDFLKIDTEGYDRNVFRSRGSLVPRVIVTEFEDSKTLELGYSAGDYAEELVEAGYRVWVSEWDPIVRSRRGSLMASPLSVHGYRPRLGGVGQLHRSPRDCRDGCRNHRRAVVRGHDAWMK